MNDSKALVLCVGGSPRPIAVSINHFKPQFLYFLCSQQSLDMVPEILGQVEYEFNPANKKVKVTEDANDLVECFRKSEEIIADLFKSGFTREDIKVDYTGGTKNMTAAMTLASARFGVDYVYVGGSARTKDGLGVVIDGSESVKTSVNPWLFFAVDEKQRISQAF